ncbi:homocysteine S-methyltransferase family protein [Martelella radicis]|uniref:Homocysteine S-methyltransferase n=1 Tax=Martelella radicis TaxID=1397476 RepID=A0A7W6PBW0_9HYPH|nr:homocysteine S-methyltransferase family protein [Martelella radicis]MBB4123054.1 homocysteine S-methyltransferase [Martelella radicis]
MTALRNRLPLAGDAFLLTDSGLETYLIFHEGLDLPSFASYPLLETAEGMAVLETYFRRHLRIAARHGTGFVLEAPTWRANRDWGATLGHTPEDLRRFNQKAIAMLEKLRGEMAEQAPVLISGNAGPRGDGYQPDTAMTAKEAEDYHGEQIGWFAETAADMVGGFTFTTVAEGVGFIRAATARDLPSVVAYTVETDGRLPDGTPLAEAIRETDAATGSAAAYLMINCAHPDHFRPAIEAGEEWTKRIGGIRANASRMSHEELDNATELDDGDPAGLGEDYRALIGLFPNVRVFGGCCGTDHRHVAAIAKACDGHFKAAAR